MSQVDTRGLSCPEPVILTKQALEQGTLPVSVLVSDMTPLENIRRYAENNGYKVEEKAIADEWELTITK
ncbi:MAG TPA: hypothetical protein GXZ89_05110 [Fastidiosipila sp.]|nr:hypothetical protein [Fastidiosipila sp.]